MATRTLEDRPATKVVRDFAQAIGITPDGIGAHRAQVVYGNDTHLVHTVILLPTTGAFVPSLGWCTECNIASRTLLCEKCSVWRREEMYRNKTERWGSTTPFKNKPLFKPGPLPCI